MLDVNFFDELRIGLATGEDLEDEDFSSDADPMLDAEIPAGDAEGVLEEDEA